MARIRRNTTLETPRADQIEETEDLSRREEEPQIAETGMGIEPWPKDTKPVSDRDAPADEAANLSPS